MFLQPSAPSAKNYPDVIQFRQILTKDGKFDGGYLCVNCRKVVVSNYTCNNKRIFTGHLNKCANFLEKKYGDNNLNEVDHLSDDETVGAKETDDKDREAEKKG